MNNPTKCQFSKPDFPIKSSGLWWLNKSTYISIYFFHTPRQHTHNFPLHDPDKSNADWIDCDPIKYGARKWPDLRTEHEQKHLGPECLCSQWFTALLPALSISLWVQRVDSAVWKRILHQGTGQLTGSLSTLSYLGYVSGKLKQSSQGYKLLWKFKKSSKSLEILMRRRQWGWA